MALDINSKSILLNLDNIDIFRKEYNERMKILYGVNNWIREYEEKNKCQLEDFIGKTCGDIKDILSCGDIKDILSYIDRDSYYDDYIFT